MIDQVSIKILNKTDWINCQKFLFKNGYFWNDGDKIYTPGGIFFPIYLEVHPEKLITYGGIPCFYNSIEFTKFMREYKLKRILK